MSTHHSDTNSRERPRRLNWRRIRRGCGCCFGSCGGVVVILFVLVFWWLQRVPQTYPGVEHPIPPPDSRHPLGGDQEGFASPYIGHTGSWDGKGGAMGGKSKIGDMDQERAMGLRWTFMPVYWSVMEPTGPVELSRDTPAAWRELDQFVIAAHERKLNILMQAPVVGGNAGGPPDWAGRREKGKAAPENMQALADFAGKLAARYAPDGTLARQLGWTDHYGVRAWEMDNEPASYGVCWKGQAADYAEFVTRAAARIRQADSHAVIVAPGLAAGGGLDSWLTQALSPTLLAGSPTFKRNGIHYSLGPSIDVVSFHIYEGLDTAFAGKDRTVERAFTEMRAAFESGEKQSPGFEYSRKQEYWHTEGNFDFLGVLSAHRRAAWRTQFMTRAFAAGIRKVVVMDASPVEQAAVGAYVQALPDPFPMQPANDVGVILRGKATLFRHTDRANPTGGQVWVVWAQADTGDAEIEIPVTHAQVETISIEGYHAHPPLNGNRVRLHLTGDEKMPAPLLLIDR